MDNYALADQFSLLSKLMDIHGENSFKSKSYASAAFTLEKLPQEIADLPKEKIFAIKGIGESVGNKIMELLETGSLPLLQDYLSKTPAGVLEMMNIKGLGPKKIHTLWKEMSIDSIGALAKACEENRIASTKGFGEKTQQNILQSIQFQQDNKGKYLYAKLETFAEAMTAKLKEQFPDERFELAGAYRRQLEIVETLEWVTTASSVSLQKFLLTENTSLVSDRDGLLVVNAEDTLLLSFHCTEAAQFGTAVFKNSSSPEFLADWEKAHGLVDAKEEEDIFKKAGLAYLPPYLREAQFFQDTKASNLLDGLVQTSGIKGLIHSHSNWSDGAHTIEEMARELISLGFEYLVISDHSKAAYYANGLSEQRIREQHRYIDELNEKLAPFHIFKSIECDILGDGSLDYSNKVLSTFDLVIASVHSNLDMDEAKAMQRLMGAIENPYVTMMGHLTGRILLRRKGYPVDHKKIIDACAANGVAIEVNASPSRLDIDWRWISYAREKGVMLSINPDAHTLDEFHNVKYGVLVAQKGGLQASENISSMNLEQFRTYLKKQKENRSLS